MKTSVEKKGSLGRKLTIEIPAEQVSSAFDRVYKGIQKNANIKGFRKGKVPLTMIKNMYADRAKSDVLNELIRKSYSQALNEHSLKPITEPTVNFEKLEEAVPFQFTAEFDVHPEIELKKIENLHVDKEKLDVSEERINAVLDQIRSSRATFVPIFEDRAAQKGDTIEIDFAGTVHGQALEGATASSYKLELGSGNFIPGFEDGLIGARAGDQKSLNLTFPADYNKAELAGQPVQFAITVKALLRKELPELNDDFAKSLGGPVSTVADLRKTIEDDIVHEESHRIQDQVKNNVLHALVNENPVEVPPALKAEQKKALLADTEERLTKEGMPQSEREEYKRKWEKEFDEMAEFMIRSSLLVDAIAEKHGLQASRADIDIKLERWSKQTGLEIAKLRKYYFEDSNHLNRLMYQITEEKVVNFLLEKADVHEVSPAAAVKTT